MRHVLPAMSVTAEPGALVQRLCASDTPVEELVFAWFLRRRCERFRWETPRVSCNRFVPSKNGVYKVTFFDENYSFYFQDFPSKLPNSWILARAYSILSGVLDSRRVRFSKRYHDAPNTATKILSDKTMILFSHFIFAVPSYHLVLLALEFIHNFNFPLPFFCLYSNCIPLLPTS